MARPTEDLTCDIVLRDGSTVSIRPAVNDDVPALDAFFRELSPESRYQRFLGPITPNRAAIAGMIPADDTDGLCLVALARGRIAAVAAFYTSRTAPTRAEVAFTVSDALQGRGIGTRLLDRLAAAARARGIDTFDADVRGDNSAMLEMFASSGYEVVETRADPIERVRISLAPTGAQLERAADRSQIAATASMRPIFEPRAVAVVGAGRERGKIGAEILHNLIATGFSGPVYPIHPSADEIQGRRAYRRAVDVGAPIDLALIVVPAAQVLDAVDDCLAAGARGVCVISAGFSETGPEGAVREAALLSKIRAAGSRLVGPNCMGLLNTDPAFTLNATFAPVYPPAGPVAMSTQSGALGLAILDYAKRLNIGISSFVSVGNKPDVSGNDLIQYWASDPRTSVILLYLESFGNPRKFSEIARRVGRAKPIAAVKAGRSRAGARAASSHTGALASDDAAVDALFRQAGVIRTETLQELFDVAALLAHQPLPRGRRVAIVTNAGGPGILAADACEANGLELPALGESTRAELRSFLPASASVGNPVDMIASATPEHYRRSLAAVLRDDAVDSVLTIFIPPLVTDPGEVADAVRSASAAAPGKPVLGIFMSAEGAPAALAPIPSYAFPEQAAIALARVASHAEWRQTPEGRVPDLDCVDPDAAARIVDEGVACGAGWLPQDQVTALLDAMGIAQAASRLAKTAEEAAAAAAAIGYPVVVKGTGAALLHKTERNALRLNLSGDASVRRACAELEASLGADLQGFLVQRMVGGGVEMIVGMTQDPTFGPLILCGMGGVLVDVLADTSFRLHPLTEEGAADMIDELKGARLLRGYRGAPAADEQALAGILLRVSALITLCPDIQELDFNPVKVLPSGAVVVDARVRVERTPPRPNRRRLEY
ncbi:MAG TPA: GNAT family N-acetyltransferase [Vicinamibacterales bacterium]